MTGIIDLTSDDDVKSSNEPINVSTDSEEDEDLKLAIALSLSEQNNDTDHQNSSLNDTKEADEPKISTLTGGLLGLDRKAMEAERLARLKRKREADGEPKISSAQDPTSMSRTVSPPPIRRPRFSTPSPSSSQPSRAPSERPSQPSAPGSSSKGTTFLRPKILLTSTASNNPDGVSLTKLLTPPSPDLTLKSALLSSFIADFDWLLPHFNTRRTSFVLVLHAHNAQHRQLLQADFDGLKNVRLIMPECLGGSGNMHSKLMLLFFKRNNTESGIKGGEVCRLVIPSANLTPADWGVGGIMENIAFVVDLPVKTESSRNPKKFETELKKQLYAMEVPADVIRKIESLDFRATENFGFVHSMSLSRTLQTTSKASSVKNGGIDHFLSGANIDSREIEPPPTSDADDLTRTGLLSLSDTVSSLGLSVHASDPAYPPRVDYITSSLGNLSMDFIRQFYDAVCGTLDPGMLRAGAKSKSLRSAIQTDNAPFDSVIKQNLRIYFPTEETVRNSKGGPSSAGTICFSKKWWETNDLIRECLCDCIGARQDGILMHNKILYIRFKEPKIVQVGDGRHEAYAGWAYVGSANLSESAWGRVTIDTKLKLPKTTCRNWECGVVIPVTARGDISACHSNTVGHRIGLFDKGIRNNSSRYSEDQRTDSQEPKSHRTPPEKMPTSLTEGAIPIVENPCRLRRQSGLQIDMRLESSEEETRSTKFMLAALNEVFPGQVPVPIVHPTLRHVELQQIPWFFRD